LNGGLGSPFNRRNLGKEDEDEAEASDAMLCVLVLGLCSNGFRVQTACGLNESVKRPN